MGVVADLVLSSTRNPRVKAVAALRDRRARDEAGLTLIDGVREVARAVAGGAAIVEVYVDRARLRDDGVGRRGRPRVPRAPRSSSARPSSSTVSPTATAATGSWRSPGSRTCRSTGSCCRPIRSSSSSRAWRSRATSGAVLRSADGAGADAVIAADPRTDLFNPNAVRASQGTLFALPVAAGPSRDVRAWLRDRGVSIVAAKVDGARPLLGRRPARAGGDRPRQRGDRAHGRLVGRRRRRGPAADAGRGRQPQRVDRRGRPAVRGAATARPRPGRLRACETFDFVIIGAGPAGEGAAHKARELGATVAIVDRRWFGGSCPHIGCVPSKALLHSAERHWSGADYSWQRASERRDYMVNRPAGAAEPDDRSHVASLEGGGRGDVPRRSAGSPRRVASSVRPTTVQRPSSAHETSSSRSAPSSKVPPIEGLAETHPWTNEQATLTRELPKSLLVLGGGPTGCELAQVFVRFGVPTTIVQSGPRLRPDRAPAQRRDRPLRAGARRRHGPDRRPCGPRPGRRRQGRRARDRPRRRLDRRGPRDPARRRPRVPAGRPRDGALRRRRLRAGRLPARRPAAHRRRAVGGGRSRRARAAHPPGPLPGRARGPDGARRGDRARLPRAAAGDVHGPGVGVGRRDARPGASSAASTRSSASPTSRRARRGTRSRRRPGT